MQCLSSDTETPNSYILERFLQQFSKSSKPVELSPKSISSSVELRLFQDGLNNAGSGSPKKSLPMLASKRKKTHFNSPDEDEDESPRVKFKHFRQVTIRKSLKVFTATAKEGQDKDVSYKTFLKNSRKAEGTCILDEFLEQGSCKVNTPSNVPSIYLKPDGGYVNNVRSCNNSTSSLLNNGSTIPSLPASLADKSDVSIKEANPSTKETDFENINPTQLGSRKQPIISQQKHIFFRKSSQSFIERGSYSQNCNGAHKLDAFLKQHNPQSLHYRNNTHNMANKLIKPQALADKGNNIQAKLFRYFKKSRHPQKRLGNGEVARKNSNNNSSRLVGNTNNQQSLSKGKKVLKNVDKGVRATTEWSCSPIIGQTNAKQKELDQHPPICIRKKPLAIKFPFVMKSQEKKRQGDPFTEKIQHDNISNSNINSGEHCESNKCNKEYLNATGFDLMLKNFGSYFDRSGKVASSSSTGNSDNNHCVPILEKEETNLKSISDSILHTSQLESHPKSVLFDKEFRHSEASNEIHQNSIKEGTVDNSKFVPNVVEVRKGPDLNRLVSKHSIKTIEMKSNTERRASKNLDIVANHALIITNNANITGLNKDGSQRKSDMDVQANKGLNIDNRNSFGSQFSENVMANRDGDGGQPNTNLGLQKGIKKHFVTNSCASSQSWKDSNNSQAGSSSHAKNSSLHLAANDDQNKLQKNDKLLDSQVLENLYRIHESNNWDSELLKLNNENLLNAAGCCSFGHQDSVEKNTAVALLQASRKSAILVEKNAVVALPPAASQERAIILSREPTNLNRIGFEKGNPSISCVDFTQSESNFNQDTSPYKTRICRKANESSELVSQQSYKLAKTYSNITENCILFKDNLLQELIEEKPKILKLVDKNNNKKSSEGGPSEEVLAKTYIKRYRKGKMRIFKIKKRFKQTPQEPYEPPEDQIMDNFIKKLDKGFQDDNDSTEDDDRESIPTPSSYITDDSKSVLSSGSSKLLNHQKLLREGINRLSKNPALLFSRFSDRAPEELESDEILARIQKIICNIVDDYEHGRKPAFKIPREDLSNCVFRNERYQIKNSPDMTVVAYGSKRPQIRFNLMLFILNKIRILLETGGKLTKREIFYQLKWAVTSQGVTNRIIKEISRMLNVGVWALNVTAQKGLVYGNLKLVMENGETINCNVPGTLVPKDVSEICEIHSDAYFILVVEKESIFHKLLEENLPNRLTRPFILITGKGFPDLNTQLFLKKLWMIMTIPVFILVDGDPDGIAIMLNYRFGSVANAHVSQHLAIPKARWIGVFPSEITKLNLDSQALSKREIAKTQQLLQLQCVQENEEIRDQLQTFLEEGVKSGIEGLMKTETYLSHRYLTLKFYNNDLI